MADIFVQHTDNTTESIPCTQGSSLDKVMLGRAPKAPLSLANENFARATFWIVRPPQLVREQSFLLVDKEAKNNFMVLVKAVNYDDRYYQHDTVVATEESWPWAGD